MMQTRGLICVVLLGVGLCGVVGCSVGPLPERFTDRVVYRVSKEGKALRGELPYDVNYGVTIDWDGIVQDRAVGFEMVLVSGDLGKGIEPFYISATEVTWDMFVTWAFIVGVDGVSNEHAEIRAGLGPSKMAPEVILMGMGKRPAISMSWQAAEAYCAWLSAQTGRRYRLPTDEEWGYAMERGGGVPSERDAVLARAWLRENAETMTMLRETDPFSEDGLEVKRAIPLTGEVGLRDPDALGLYDMLGNAAEWVRQGDRCVLRGGHYQLSVGELTADWTLEEDRDVWDAGYAPNRWSQDQWYGGVLFQGFRLVCEPVNAR